MRILAIDDDSRVRKVLEPMLEFWQHPKGLEHETFFAHNGLEGIQWVQAQGMPDLILLDVRMPVMGGAAFLQRAHQQHWQLNGKVLLLTGYADDLERHIGSEAVDMPHLRKPFTMSELHTCLDLLIMNSG